VPQLTEAPHPLLTVPHVSLPHVGAVQLVHVPLTHLFVPSQPPHWTVPLPQALAMEPHFAPGPPSTPASAGSHSGGVVAHTPPKHCWPAGHEHCLVLPHPSPIVPHRLTFLSGVQVSGAQPESATPASVSGVQALFTQACPVGHPPQLMGTPQESVPMTPHWPMQVEVVSWQLWAGGLPTVPTQTSPLPQGMPQAMVSPLQVT